MKLKFSSRFMSTKSNSFLKIKYSSFSKFDNKFVKEYQENGYAHIPGVFPKDLIDELKAEVNTIIDQSDISELKSKFDTKHESSDKYFIESGDKIRFFLEKNAYDERGNLIHPIKESINKIGHGMPFRFYLS